LLERLGHLREYTASRGGQGQPVRRPASRARFCRPPMVIEAVPTACSGVSLSDDTVNVLCGTVLDRWSKGPRVSYRGRLSVIEKPVTGTSPGAEAGAPRAEGRRCGRHVRLSGPDPAGETGTQLVQGGWGRAPPARRTATGVRSHEHGSPGEATRSLIRQFRAGWWLRHNRLCRAGPVGSPTTVAQRHKTGGTHSSNGLAHKVRSRGTEQAHRGPESPTMQIPRLCDAGHGGILENFPGMTEPPWVSEIAEWLKVTLPKCLAEWTVYFVFLFPWPDPQVGVK